jgi:homogentisate 1,2-dioxygenase
VPFYHKLGNIPHKRHTQFRKPDGDLYREEVMGTKGFSGIQSILYHTYPPTEVKHVEKLADLQIKYSDFGGIRHRHFKTLNVPLGGDGYSSRRAMLGNSDVSIGMARPTESMNYYYRNGDNWEVLFVHQGSGKLESIFGWLEFHEGDYIVIPVGTTYKIHFDGKDNRVLVVESATPIEFPKRYRNEYGQLLENSPYCERDLRVPDKLDTHAERGEFEVRVRAREQLHQHILAHHPLDVIGWDGYLYPWIFNIGDFEPITGRVHQPPPVHQTFEGWNFVICSFVPRLFDYHPLAIPAPYAHSNVNSDEVIYYVDGNFMSRKGVEQGSFTLHPSGLPHGPHPGTMETSIGAKETKELAVMIDTFRPLQVAVQALEFEDEKYAYSWYENGSHNDTLTG